MVPRHGKEVELRDAGGSGTILRSESLQNKSATTSGRALEDFPSLVQDRT